MLWLCVSLVLYVVRIEHRTLVPTSCSAYTGVAWRLHIDLENKPQPLMRLHCEQTIRHKKPRSAKVSVGVVACYGGSLVGCRQKMGSTVSPTVERDKGILQ
jgi:hypothetical protein